MFEKRNTAGSQRLYMHCRDSCSSVSFLEYGAPLQKNRYFVPEHGAREK